MAFRLSTLTLARSLRAAVLRPQMRGFSAVATLRAKPDMFCMQCEQTDKGTGCTVVGVCGKTPEVAGMQDLLVENLKTLSFWADQARQEGVPENQEGNRFVLTSLFATMTNVNFDSARFAKEMIPKAVSLSEGYKKACLEACKKKGKQPQTLASEWKMSKSDPAWLTAEGEKFGVLNRRDELGADISGMQELVVYGLKGLAAYATHASALGKESQNVFASVQSTMGKLAAGEKNFDNLLGLALGVGASNLEVLALLDKGHTETFGHPTPQQVAMTPSPGKCILVSGHDLHDLKQLLEQTEGKGINVYTHGEMLPAHGYPELKKYAHLKGNYGGPWQLQKFEFAKFPGPIVMTTNCLIEPRKSYKERIYSANAVGWPDVKHIATDAAGNKDFSSVIKQAQSMEGFAADFKPSQIEKPITVGFGHHTVLSVADKVIDAVKAGHIKRFFLIGGCDGNENERSYFRDVALAAPENSMILTLGCGKYRFNKHDFGTVPNVGLPRLLDMGQCNDAYGAVVVALALAKNFGTDVNGLPLTFAISWFEQKAVAVFLTLLHLGVKNIVLGPNLPAFVGPQLGGILTTKLGLRGSDPRRVQQDVAAWMQ